MAEPTLIQIFGTNATQDSSTITISKSDLAGVGLTASASNSAESLLVAILLKASAYLTQTAQDANIDQSVVVEQGTSNIITRNNQSYREYTINVSASKLDTQTTINPGDF